MPFQSNPGKNLSRDSLSLGLQSRRRLTNYLQESHPVGLEQFGDAFFVDLRDDDLADLGMNIGEDAHALHPLCLKFVVLCRGHIVHRAGIVAVDEEQLGYRHQALLAYRRERVLVANRQDASPATILVVEDSITTRTLEKNILQAAGYRVRTAADGGEGWSLLESGDCDLVLADVDMPVMNGFELTARIRANQRHRDLPVVLVTSLDAREDRERGIQAGADAYIVKRKFDQQEILNTIRQLL